MVDQQLINLLLKSGFSDRQIRHILSKRLGRPVSAIEVRKILGR